jgi:pyruvate/2-oxoglutarate dehydrogenase complex dihydrolipoamide dehydrogenase (E3) component
MATQTHDLIVIGTGMAGINATLRAREAGARVAIVERAMVGGTCPTRGCIPTKALIRSAEVAGLVGRGEEFGLRVAGWSVDFAAVMARVRAIIERGSNATAAYLESLEGVDLVLGEARFTGAHSVAVEGRPLTAPRVIVASGAEPSVPPIPGLDTVTFLTSDDVLRLDALPARIVVIGGGPIALELGQALSRLGATLTLVEIADRIMPGAEPDLVDVLVDRLEEEGVRIVTGARIDRVATGPDGRPAVVLTAPEPVTLAADALVVATGRRPAVGALDLPAAGVDTEEGRPLVDARLRTSRPGVWAAGDVLGPPFGAYTHVARRLGVAAAENALGLDPHDVDRDVGPRAVFTDPELVMLGLTEAGAREAGHDVVVGTGTFSGGRARAMGEEVGGVRILLERGTRRILGAHLLGHHAAELVHPVAVAMAAPGGTPDPVLATPFIHPTLGEVVRNAVDAADRGG